jgi:uncharacterized protein
VDVNKKDDDGNTPLYYAIMREGIDAVKLLIDHEAEVNVKNNVGDTLLDIAIINENKNDTTSEIINALFENNKDLEFTTDKSKAAAGQYLLTLLTQDPTNNDLITKIINAGADLINKTTTATPY